MAIPRNANPASADQNHPTLPTRLRKDHANTASDAVKPIAPTTRLASADTMPSYAGHREGVTLFVLAGATGPTVQLPTQRSPKTSSPRGYTAAAPSSTYDRSSGQSPAPEPPHSQQQSPTRPVASAPTPRRVHACQPRAPLHHQRHTPVGDPRDRRCSRVYPPAGTQHPL